MTTAPSAPERPQRIGARVNAKGQHILVPRPDLNPGRLALRQFSWDRADSISTAQPKGERA